MLLGEGRDRVFARPELGGAAVSAAAFLVGAGDLLLDGALRFDDGFGLAAVGVGHGLLLIGVHAAPRRPSLAQLAAAAAVPPSAPGMRPPVGVGGRPLGGAEDADQVRAGR